MTGIPHNPHNIWSGDNRWVFFILHGKCMSLERHWEEEGSGSEEKVEHSKETYKVHGTNKDTFEGS